MSALQVEKHPLTTPGPYTPPPGARVLPGVGLFAVTPPHTPRASPLPPRFGSPRPHSSPKMKLRFWSPVTYWMCIVVLPPCDILVYICWVSMIGFYFILTSRCFRIKIWILDHYFVAIPTLCNGKTQFWVLLTGTTLEVQLFLGFFKHYYHSLYSKFSIVLLSIKRHIS